MKEGEDLFDLTLGAAAKFTEAKLPQKMLPVPTRLLPSEHLASDTAEVEEASLCFFHGSFIIDFEAC